MNRWTHPVQWMQGQMDLLLEKVAHLEKEILRQGLEINRLDAEKAGKRGPKPATRFVHPAPKDGSVSRAAIAKAVTQRK